MSATASTTPSAEGLEAYLRYAHAHLPLSVAVRFSAITRRLYDAADVRRSVEEAAANVCHAVAHDHAPRLRFVGLTRRCTEHTFFHEQGPFYVVSVLTRDRDHAPRRGVEISALSTCDFCADLTAGRFTLTDLGGRDFETHAPACALLALATLRRMHDLVPALENESADSVARIVREAQLELWDRERHVSTTPLLRFLQLGRVSRDQIHAEHVRRQLLM